MGILFVLIVTIFLVESLITQLDPAYEIGDWETFGLWLDLSILQPRIDSVQVDQIFNKAFGVQPLNDWRKSHPRLVKVRTRYTRLIRKAINGYFDAWGCFPDEIRMTPETWKKWEAELKANGDVLTGYVANREHGVVGAFEGMIIHVQPPFEGFIPTAVNRHTAQVLPFRGPQS